MDYFLYKNNRLYCEDIDLNKLVLKYKTPFYLYSYRTIIEHFKKLREAFLPINNLICFSVKSNSNLTILKILKNEGSGFDIVSGGELYRVLKIKADPKKIVFAGVGKTKEEIEFGIKSNILMFNCESFNEICLINKIAEKLNKKVNIAIRINPDIELETHHYIKTGREGTKFGISIRLLTKNLNLLKALKNIEIIGIHFHIGSQIITIDPYILAIKKIIGLIKFFKDKGFNLKYINIGGGLGVIYKKEKPLKAAEFASFVIPLVKPLNLTLLLEPGRFIVGNGGILVSKVIYFKKEVSKNFLIIDAGMNDLIRPALYNAYHQILPLIKNEKLKKMKVDVVGPVCESSDFIAKERELQKLSEGDFIAIKTAGAYGFAMASNYNSRVFPLELLVKGNKCFVIRKRGTYRDLIRNEILWNI